ncbi:50S ribosomal protein L18 [Patescibacteria group bacterium]|jgi:large subunit ribosomal protein L18|nr:50S ribosomal protein L18 [Patescibacteria group bacterium]
MQDLNKAKRERFFRRQRRTRAKIQGTNLKPRLSVFRSLKHISVQAIDDLSRVTLAAADDSTLKDKVTKTELALKVGELLAKKLQEKNIETAVFDKGAYRYHGRVKALAEGLRNSGIKF